MSSGLRLADAGLSRCYFKVEKWNKAAKEREKKQKQKDAKRKGVEGSSTLPKKEAKKGCIDSI